MKCGVINDVKLFPTVYRTIYCHKFLTLSNQTSRYKSKCIRITILRSKVLFNWTYGNETLQPYPDCYFVSRLASLPLLVYRGSFFFFFFLLKKGFVDLYMFITFKNFLVLSRRSLGLIISYSRIMFLDKPFLSRLDCFAWTTTLLGESMREDQRYIKKDSWMSCG